MIVLLASAAATVGADLFSKQVARLRLPAAAVPGRHAWFSVGLLQNRRGAIVATSPLVATLLWLAASLLLAVVINQTASLPALVETGLGLALGGATANLAERLLRGSVTDFLFIRHWPVFNVADAAMTCGLLLSLGGLL